MLSEELGTYAKYAILVSIALCDIHILFSEPISNNYIA
jgi:hypothetical protein